MLDAALYFYAGSLIAPFIALISFWLDQADMLLLFWGRADLHKQHLRQLWATIPHSFERRPPHVGTLGVSPLRQVAPRLSYHVVLLCIKGYYGTEPTIRLRLKIQNVIVLPRTPERERHQGRDAPPYTTHSTRAYPNYGKTGPAAVWAFVAKGRTDEYIRMLLLSLIHTTPSSTRSGVDRPHSTN